MANRDNGATFGSCISANVRRALGQNKTKQRNNKCGSEKYWNEACDVLGQGLSAYTIKHAKDAYLDYKNAAID